VDLIVPKLELTGSSTAILGLDLVAEVLKYVP
jgi:hypothetical protein